MSKHDWDVHSLLGKQKFHKILLSGIPLEEFGKSLNQEEELRALLLSILEHWKPREKTKLSVYDPIDIITIDELFKRNFSKDANNETHQDPVIKGILKRLSKVEDKLKFIETAKVVVNDYPRETIDKYKEILLERTGKSREIDPWEFAEEEKIEIDLSLTCFDELISEGRLDKVNEQDS